MNNCDNRKIPELILPAGSFEKLKYALAYGADAVYAGPSDLSLRANMNDFTLNTLKDAIIYTHNQGKKIYVALNIFAHEDDLEKVRKYAVELSEYKPDAFIVSDPGVLRILKDEIPINIPIHLSTQINTTNSESVKFWIDQGVKRIILARELSFVELKTIIQKVGKYVELEIFIHGAMCVSYSGRCLLSNFLSGRDSNRGECNQPCRWRYYLIEEKRPDQRLEILENKRGTYILNSKDLCLIDKLEELSILNIDGYKIEGRTKNIFYLSLVALAYRKVIDRLYGISYIKESKVKFSDLINLTDNHGFTHGFLFNDGAVKQNINEKNYKKQSVLGYVKAVNDDGLLVRVKNPIRIKDNILAINPEIIEYLTITEIIDLDGNKINEAYGSKGDIVTLRFNKELKGDRWKFGIISKTLDKN